MNQIDPSSAAKHAICAMLALAATYMCMNVIVESGMAKLHQPDVMLPVHRLTRQQQQRESDEKQGSPAISARPTTEGNLKTSLSESLRPHGHTGQPVL